MKKYKITIDLYVDTDDIEQLVDKIGKTDYFNEQKLDKINVMRIDDVLDEVEEKQFKYPIYRENINFGVIVKFESPISGMVVAKPDYTWPIGFSSDNWGHHEDKTLWKKTEVKDEE